MKTKIKYVADDGTEFDSDLQAARHENMCDLVAQALAPLGKRNKSTKGWVQHNPETVRQASRQFLRVCKTFNFVDSFKTEFHPRSSVGKIVSEGPVVLTLAWNRFASIDAQGREHNQPYFAINGPDPDQYEL